MTTSTTEQQLRDLVLDTCHELENEDLDAYEWLQEALCVESVMRAPSGEFQGIEVTTACGGPTVRVNTCTSSVEGWWGSDHAEQRFNDNDRLNEVAEELFYV